MVVRGDGRTTSPFDAVSYDRFGGICAIVAGVGALGYSLAFVLLLQTSGRGAEVATSIFLLAGGLVALPVWVAVYERLRVVSSGFALLALVLGVTSALGTAIHGGLQVGNLAHERTGQDFSINPVNPRGLLTFVFTALALVIIGWLALRSGVLPRALAILSLVLAALLLVVYFGRLVIYDPKNPVLLGAAGLTGFVLNPVWFIWLGVSLRRRDIRA